MRPMRLLSNAGGVLALAATVALASPGVRAVRAADEAPPPEAGAQCGGEAPVSSNARIEAVLEQVRREQQARAASGEELPVVLNGRGYNYGPAPRIDLDRIRAEAAAAPR